MKVTFVICDKMCESNSTDNDILVLETLNCLDSWFILAS